MPLLLCGGHYGGIIMMWGTLRGHHYYERGSKGALTGHYYCLGVLKPCAIERGRYGSVWWTKGQSYGVGAPLLCAVWAQFDICGASV